MIIRSWHRWLFILAALLLLVTLGTTFRSIRLTGQTTAKVLHSNEVMAMLLRLRALISETEANARGYALTDDTLSLALMGQSRADTLRELQRIKEMTSDDSGQQHLVQQISALVESRFTAFDLMVTRRGVTSEPKTAIPLLDDGRGIMRALQARLDEGLEREQAVFHRQNERRTRHLQTLHGLALGSGAMALLTAAGGLVLMKRAQQAALRAAVLELDKTRAEHASEMKSRFLADVSHEIRTPMTAILGYAEILTHAPHNPKDQECVNAIRLSGQSMLRLVNDILDLSRIEAGRLTLIRQPVNVRDILHEVRLLLGGEIEKKGLAFICRASPEVPDSLSLDPLRVKQVLTNLVTNAMKFTEEGSVALEAFGTRREGSRPLFDLQFRVSDTGCGISPPDHERIFKDFEQVAETPAKQGAGLGLGITRRLVELMEGSITLKSELGEGTFVTVDLPAVPMQPKTPADAWEPTALATGK